MMEELQTLALEKGMTTEVLLEAVANGLESAYKRMPEAADDAYVVIDENFKMQLHQKHILSLIHIRRCRRIESSRSLWSPYH